MDSFVSDTLSSDDSISSDDTTLSEKVHRKKIRKIEDRTLLNISESDVEQIKQLKKTKRPKLSFLPKIDLEDDLQLTEKPKENKPTSSKNIATLKLGKHKIEGRVHGNKNTSAKIKIKVSTVRNKYKLKNRERTANRMKIKPVKSVDLQQILSDAAEEFSANLTFVKRCKFENLPVVENKMENITNSTVLLKGLHVCLIPLEKTGLLTEDQILKLNAKRESNTNIVPLQPRNFTKSNLSIRRKSYSGKENSFTNANIPLKHSMTSVGHVKSSASKIFKLPEMFPPCKVIIKKLTLEEIQFLTPKNSSRMSSPYSKALINDVTNRSRRTGSLAKSKKHSDVQTSKISVDSSFVFHPEGSSSPLVSHQELQTSGREQETISTVPECLTYEIEESGNKNGTYEIDIEKTNQSSRRSRQAFEELHQSDDEKEICNSKLDCNKNKSKSASRRSNKNVEEKTPKSAKNLTYELEADGDKDRTFEIAVPNNNGPTLLTGRNDLHKRYTYNFETNEENIFAKKPFKRRSLSCDSWKADAATKLQKETDQSFINTTRKSSTFTQNSSNTPGVIEGRRSTLTLEDSVNNIALLKAGCDVSTLQTTNNDVQQRNLNRKKSHSLTEGLLKKKSFKSRLSYSNVTLRKQNTVREKSGMGKLMRTVGFNRSSATALENISPPWSRSSSDTDSSVEEVDDASQVNETDDFKVSSGTFGETSKHKNVRFDRNSLNIDNTIGNNDNEVTSVSSSSLSPDLNTSKQRRSSTLETDTVEKSTASSDKLPRKSSMRKSKNHITDTQNRRVTFSNMSVIIVDSDVSLSSPDSKSSGTLIATNFHSDVANKLSKDLLLPLKNISPLRQKSSAGRTPKKVDDLLQFNKKGKIGCTPLKIKLSDVNKRGTISRTPLRFKITNRTCNKLATPNINKEFDLDDRIKLLEAETFASPAPKNVNSTGVNKIRTVMPDFASLHQKLFDRMKDIKQYSEEKKQRANCLLSGHKPIKTNTSINKQVHSEKRNLPKTPTMKKQLTYSEQASTSKLPKKKQIFKKAQLVTSTPKPKKNQQSGYTRYGFKVTQAATKKDQLLAIANKTRPLKSCKEGKRTEIQGVRSNRRFDLLMKMRQKQ